jgi:hypothetical protein
MKQALDWGVRVGVVTFLLGFIGPMVLDPTSGNGPLLGIFITGPAGFVLGALWGVARAWRQRRSTRDAA